MRVMEHAPKFGLAGRFIVEVLLINWLQPFSDTLGRIQGRLNSRSVCPKVHLLQVIHPVRHHPSYELLPCHIL